MYTFTFGKYKGQDIESVFQSDPGYVQWVADNSIVSVAARAAEKLVREAGKRAARTKDTLETRTHTLLCDLEEQNPHAALAEYQFDLRLSDGVASITFERGDVMDEEWNVVEIRSALPQPEEEEHYEGWEDTPRAARQRAVAPDPQPEVATWTAFPNNLGEHALNAQPVTLAEAIALLEQHLT